MRFVWKPAVFRGKRKHEGELVLKVRLELSLCPNMNSMNCVGCFTAVKCPDNILSFAGIGAGSVAHFIDCSKIINIINLTSEHVYT